MDYKTSDYLPEECTECGGTGFRYRKKEQGWKCMNCGFVIGEEERILNPEEVKETGSEIKIKRKPAYENDLPKILMKDYLSEYIKSSRRVRYAPKVRERPHIPKSEIDEMIEKKVNEEMKEMAKREDAEQIKLKEKVKSKYPRGIDFRDAMKKLAELSKKQVEVRAETVAKNEAKEDR